MEPVSSKSKIQVYQDWLQTFNPDFNSKKKQIIKKPQLISQSTTPSSHIFVAPNHLHQQSLSPKPLNTHSSSLLKPLSEIHTSSPNLTQKTVNPKQPPKQTNSKRPNNLSKAKKLLSQLSYKWTSKSNILQTSQKEQRTLTPSASRVSLHTEKTGSSFTPKLSNKTRRLANKKGTSTDRLLAITPSPQMSFDDSQCSFTPQVNKRSKIMDNRIKRKTDGSSVARWEALYDLKHLREERIKRRTEQLKEIERKKQIANRGKIVGSVRNVSSKQVVQRLNSWAQRRDLKIQNERDQELKHDMKKCSFSPVISKSPQQSTVNLYGYKGVYDHIKRNLTPTKSLKYQEALRNPKERKKTPPKKPISMK